MLISIGINILKTNKKSIKKEFKSKASLDFSKIMEEQEKKLIAYALKKEKTTRKAAELLNIPQPTLARKKIKYGL